MVTYRLHAALPCLAFGTPVISISYDERALSLIDTVGFGDWDIDLVQTPDLLNDVIVRHHRLNELGALRLRAQPIWNRLYATMRGAFQEFASEVRAGIQANDPVSAPPLRRSA